MHIKACGPGRHSPTPKSPEESIPVTFKHISTTKNKVWMLSCLLFPYTSYSVDRTLTIVTCFKAKCSPLLYSQFHWLFFHESHNTTACVISVLPARLETPWGQELCLSGVSPHLQHIAPSMSSRNMNRIKLNLYFKPSMVLWIMMAKRKKLLLHAAYLWFEDWLLMIENHCFFFL